MSKVYAVGIDVSARTLKVALADESLHDFANSATGHRKLTQLLRRRASTGSVIRVCIEATGNYSLDLALHLHASDQVEVMVANPRAVANFAKAIMARRKSDPVDAVVQMEFARRMPFVPWAPPSVTALQLRTAARRFDALTKNLVRERNRLHAARSTETTPAFIVDDLECAIRELEKRIERLVKSARSLVEQDPQLHARFQQLLTVCGIADRSAIRILGELAVLPVDMTARQCVAHAGLDPCERQSGTSLSGARRISKRGNSYLRTALYMPAVVAARRDPVVHAFYAQLLIRAKKPMQALVAIMRKLIHGIFGMLKSGSDFDSRRLFPNVKVEVDTA